MTPRVGLVVVAAGSSRRMDGCDKVWAELGDEPLLVRSLRTLAPLAAAVVLVVREDRMPQAEREVSLMAPGLQIVAGGRERQESVRSGLEALPRLDIIAVHDAARPLVTADILRRGIARLEAHDAAIPVIAVHDTLRRVGPNGDGLETVDRASMRAVQTPQIFREAALAEVHRVASEEGWVGTDDASLAERLGLPIITFEGSPQNFKVTTEFDLHVARLLVRSDG